LLPSLSRAFDTPLGSVGSLLPAGVCYRALRRLPGQDFHLLEQRVFQDAPRLDFIRTDLWVCLTLASVAETEYDLGNCENAERTLAAIEKGYSTLVRFFSQAEGLTAAEEKELWSKFQQLGERLVQLIRKR
jgi:hypothetical protein